MKVFYTRIHDEEKIFHSLVSGFTSKGFCIANFELFFIIMTKKITISKTLWLKTILKPIIHQALRICEVSKGHF
jgi:hypothetical protein